MCDRVRDISELFLVAVDKGNGKIAGFLNGLATDEPKLRDEFFTDAGLRDPNGKNIMLLGLDVLPEYRRARTCKRTGCRVFAERTGERAQRDYSYLPGYESRNV